MPGGKGVKKHSQTLGILALLLFSSASIACAKPNYADPTNPNNEHNPSDERSTGESTYCPMKLPSSGLCVRIVWENNPSEDTAGSFFIRFTEPSSDDQEGRLSNPNLTPFVMLWMPSMGHGSSPVDLKSSGTPGVFHATNVFFMMRGKWEIHIQLRNGRQVMEEVIDPFTF